MTNHATEAYYRAKIKTLEDAATCQESLQVAHAVASERAKVIAETTSRCEQYARPSSDIPDEQQDRVLTMMDVKVALTFSAHVETDADDACESGCKLPARHRDSEGTRLCVECYIDLMVEAAEASERAAVVAWLSREAQAESRQGLGLSEPAWRQFEERAMHLRWLSKQISNGAHNWQAATGGGV